MTYDGSEETIGAAAIPESWMSQEEWKA